ncbi:MAG: PDZ domain-containing protein [Verrucomicrobiota bacterium]
MPAVVNGTSREHLPARLAMRFPLIPVLILFLALLDATAANQEKPPRPTDAQIDVLVENLQSDSYADRENSHQTLRNLGFHYPEDVLETLAESWFSAEDEESSYRLYSCLFGIKHDIFYKEPIGFVGISMLATQIPIANQRRDCILIREVVPGTAAERANLQINDRILSVDGLKFDGLPNRTTFFSDYVRSKQPGEKIELELHRGTEILTIDLELGERPRRYRLIWQDRVALQSEFTTWLDQQKTRLGLDEDAAEENSEKNEEKSPPESSEKLRKNSR